MTILPGDVIVMTRHNGRIEMTHKPIWLNNESLNITYNNATFPLLNISTINLSQSCYAELALPFAY